MNILNWVQRHKNITFAILIILGLLYLKNNRMFSPGSHNSTYDMGVSAPSFLGSAGIVGREKMVSDSYMPQPAIAPSASANRLKSYTASLSMVVKDVTQSVKEIEQKVTSTGGFLIDVHVSSPEEGAYGTLSLRVPTAQLQSILETIKNLGVQVTQESISSADLTDEYEDIDAKLARLQSTMSKFEAILDKADTVEESMSVQEELLNLQDRIDDLVGRKQYLEKSAELSLITITVASDELSLPYTPQDTWRPQLIFKQAVRSLVQSTRTLVNYSIWIGVYAIAWIPVLILLILIARKRNKKTRA